MNLAIAKSIQISRRALVIGAGAGAVSVSSALGDERPRNAAQVSVDNGAGPGNWLSGLALQAATYAAPIVAMYNLRETTSVGIGAKVAPE